MCIIYIGNRKEQKMGNEFDDTLLAAIEAARNPVVEGDYGLSKIKYAQAQGKRTEMPTPTTSTPYVREPRTHWWQTD